MRIRTAVSMGVLAGLVFAGIGFLSFRGEDPAPLTSRTVQYAFELRNEGGLPVRDVEISGLLPMERTDFQLCRTISTNFPHVVVPEAHSRHFRSHPVTLGPFGRRLFRVRSIVDFGRFHEKGDVEAWRHSEIRDEERRILAPVLSEVTRRKQGETARAAYDWARSRIRRAGYRARPKGVGDVLLSGSGDCTDMANLLVVLLRESGIPARRVSGFFIGESGTLSASDYHDWVEVFLEGEWELMDPFYGKFMEEENRYVATSWNRDVAEVKPRFSSSSPDVRVTFLNR